MYFRLTGHAPNTYTFTKKLAEHVCFDYKTEKKLPLVIYRPSIISSAEVEPIQGWMDSLNGPAALLFAYWAGLKRTLYCRKDSSFDCVPVDICTKGLIVAAWKKWRDLRVKREEK